MTATRLLPPVLAVLLLGGCMSFRSSDEVARDLFEVPPHAAADRVRQTRRYGTRDEAALLKTCSVLLMDLGFTMDALEVPLGVLVASKDRSAVQTGGVIAAIILTALSGADTPYEHKQRLRASIVVFPVGQRSTALRVTFQRIVWDTHGTITRREQLDDREFYDEFFTKLSKALFLEAKTP